MEVAYAYIKLTPVKQKRIKQHTTTNKVKNMASPFAIDEARLSNIMKHIESSGQHGRDPLEGMREPSVAPDPPESMPPRLRGLLYEPLDDFKVDTPVALYYSPLFNYTIEQVFGPDEQNYVAQLTQSAATDLRTGNRPLSRLMVAMAVSDIKPASSPMTSVMEALRHHPSYPDIYELVQIDKAQKQRMRLHAEGEKMKAVKSADVEHEIMYRGVQHLGTKADYETAMKIYTEAVRRYWNTMDKTKIGTPLPVKPNPDNYWDIGETKKELFRLAMRGVPEKKQLAPRVRSKSTRGEEEDETPVAVVADIPPPKIKKVKKVVIKQERREPSVGGIESGAESDMPIAKVMKKKKVKEPAPSEFVPPLMENVTI